jgi:autotransporter-associated beta strand protein
MSKFSHSLLVSAGTAALLLAAGSSAMAQSTWTGASADYNTNTNWNNSTAPVSAGQSAIFANTGATTITLSAPVAPDSWTFSSTSQGYTVTGSTATLSGGVTDNAVGKTIIISNVIAGAGGISMNDTTGVLYLGGVNTYTGATTIASGATLALSTAGSIAASAVSPTGTFDISGITATGTSITSLSSSGTVALGAKTLTLSAASGTYSGVIKNAGLATGATGGGLTISSGTETLSGANT